MLRNQENPNNSTLDIFLYSKRVWMLMKNSLKLVQRENLKIGKAKIILTLKDSLSNKNNIYINQ